MANGPTYTIKNGRVIIDYPVKYTPSKSGKSMLLASTSGKDTFTADGMEIHVNLNCYIPIDKWEEYTKSSKSKK